MAGLASYCDAMNRISSRKVISDVARLTAVQWLAVSAFEDVINLPERIAAQPAGSTFGAGSPARYHVPAAVPTLLSAVVSTAAAPQDRRRSRALALAGTALSAALTAHLIRTVNVPLLRGSASDDERTRLAAQWHRVNKIRLLALAGVCLVREIDALRE